MGRKNKVFKVSDEGIAVDYPVGQLLDIRGTICKVVEFNTNNSCALYCEGYGMCRSLACAKGERNDNKDVVFQKIK